MDILKVATVLPRAAAGVATLVLDRFVDPDGTLLTAHTPDIDLVGGGWVVSVGNGDIRGNIVEPDNIASNRVVIATTQSDVVITLDVTIRTNNLNAQIGIVFRQVDESNLWLAGYSPLDGEFRLFRRVGGGFSERAIGAWVPTEGLTYTMTVTLSGSSINCEVDGVVLAVTDAQHAAAVNHGVDMYGIGGAPNAINQEADNFRVVAN